MAIVQHGLWQEWPRGKAKINETPTMICEIWPVQLWAQNYREVGGTIWEPILMPSIQRWLLNLARSGAGGSEYYYDIKYQFTNGML